MYRLKPVQYMQSKNNNAQVPLSHKSHKKKQMLWRDEERRGTMKEITNIYKI
jgi:hypothetical protein